MAFARNGASTVVFADLNVETASAAALESSSIAAAPEYRALPIYVDVADLASVGGLFAEAKAESADGRICYCVNSAGIATPGPQPVADLPRDVFDKVQSINVGGTFSVGQTALRYMREQEPQKIQVPGSTRDIGRGAIVNVSSAMGVLAMHKAGAYVASKHAIQGITKTMALENGPLGIRVCSVLPSWTRTPLMETNFKRNPDLRDWITRACPLGRMAEVEEVADAVIFLCSPAGSFMNGAALLIDGGLTTMTCCP